MSTSDSSPSKDSESSSSSHRKSLSSSQNAASCSSVPIFPILSKLAPRQQPNLANSDPPIYTRRLIPMKYIPVDEIDENFDEDSWFRKLYGPDILVVATCGLPEGWILVDGD